MGAAFYDLLKQEVRLLMALLFSFMAQAMYFTSNAWKSIDIESIMRFEILIYNSNSKSILIGS